MEYTVEKSVDNLTGQIEICLYLLENPLQWQGWVDHSDDVYLAMSVISSRAASLQDFFKKYMISVFCFKKYKKMYD